MARKSVSVHPEQFALQDIRSGVWSPIRKLLFSTQPKDERLLTGLHCTISNRDALLASWNAVSGNLPRTRKISGGEWSAVQVQRASPLDSLRECRSAQRSACKCRYRIA